MSEERDLLRVQIIRISPGQGTELTLLKFEREIRENIITYENSVGVILGRGEKEVFQREKSSVDVHGSLLVNGKFPLPIEGQKF